jgi:hypothetical protein
MEHAPIPVDHERRKLFVAFLERYLNSEAKREDWETLVVNHYVDNTLERVRRECVRIRMHNEAMRWSPEERSRIQGWIHELQTASV